MHYAEMRPHDLTQARTQCPVAYLPLGILEWHGLHNPVGLDGIKSEKVLTYLAGKFGGLVMPPLYWADNRADVVDVICDSAISSFPPADTGDHVTPICETMQVTRQRLEEEARRSETNGGWRLWQEVLVHTLFQIESMGFEHIIPYPGHYPMLTPLTSAVDTFRATGGKADVFVLTDHLVGWGDHAAAFETSLLLALAPELVDLGELNPADTMHLGVVGEDPLKHASADYGHSILSKFATIIEAQLRSSTLDR